VPDFLNTAHTINTKEDAEAYLSRLEAFAVALDQDSAMQRIEAARGYVAPAWSLDLTLGQMTKLRGQKADESSIVQSLAKRARAKDIEGRWERRASRIVEDKVYPALDRQIALVRELRAASPATESGGCRTATRSTRSPSSRRRRHASRRPRSIAWAFSRWPRSAQSWTRS
jgi:uncharacterized protein (DUF885 family)